MKSLMFMLALSIIRGSGHDGHKALKETKEDFHRRLSRMVEEKKEQRQWRHEPYPSQTNPPRQEENVPALQRFTQTENCAMDTTTFLTDHLIVISDPRLEHSLLPRFVVFLHCIRWIVEHNRLRNVENDEVGWTGLSNKDIFIKINNKVGDYLGPYWPLPVRDELNHIMEADASSNIDDLHYLCLHSKDSDLIQMIREFINQGPFQSLRFFSREQILDLYERMSDLRVKAWKYGTVNLKLRDVYWQLSYFDQMEASDGKLVPMPLSIYHQMVDDLIKHELNDKYFCFNWLIRQIDHVEGKKVLQNYMRVYPGNIAIVLDEVLALLKDNDPRITLRDRKMIEEFKKNIPCGHLKEFWEPL